MRVDDNLDADEEEEMENRDNSSISNGDRCCFFRGGGCSTRRKSQDDTCLILYVLLSSLLVAPAIFSAGQNSRCVKSVAKLVPRVVKDGDNFGQSYSSGALRLSTEIVID